MNDMIDVLNDDNQVINDIDTLLVEDLLKEVKNDQDIADYTLAIKSTDEVNLELDYLLVDDLISDEEKASEAKAWRLFKTKGRSIAAGLFRADD